MNSDFANLILEVSDILHENPLLHGWNLTGVSFYFSELPFYVLGTALFGVDTNAYIFAAALMYILVFLLGWQLCRFGRTEICFSEAVIYLAAAGMPGLLLLSYLRGHSGAVIYLFLLLWICSRYEALAAKGRQKGYFILVVTLTAMGIMSDMLLMILLVLPVLTYAALLMKNRTAADRWKDLGLACFFGSLAGIGLDKLFFFLGGAGKNSFFQTRKFLDLSLWYEKTGLLLDSICNLFRCEVSKAAIFSLDTVQYAIAAVVMIASLFLIIKTVQSCWRGQPHDSISAILCLGIVFLLLVCFATDIFTSEDSARYIAYLPVACAVILIRTLRPVFTRHKLPVMIAALAMIALCFVPVKWERAVTPQDRLALFLEEQGLTSGYSDFWNASHVTVASNERVKIRAVRVRAKELNAPESLEMQNWFAKTAWYTDNTANFIVLGDYTYLNINEANIVKLCGAPQKRIPFENYVILVYDKNLADDVVILSETAAF